MRKAIFLPDIYTCNSLIDQVGTSVDTLITTSPVCFYNTKYPKKILLELNNDDYKESEFWLAKAKKIGLEFDLEVAKLKSEILGLKSPMVGAHYLNFFYIFHEFFQISRFFSKIETILDRVDLVIAPRLNEPQDYHFPSLITHSLWINALRNHGLQVEEVNVTSLVSNPNAYGFVLDPSSFNLDFKPDRLVHLPTVFYEAELHRTRLKKSKGVTVEIPSPFFDRSFCSNRIPLIWHEDNDLTPYYSDYSRYIRDFYELVTSEFAKFDFFYLDTKLFEPTIKRLFERDSLQLKIYIQLSSNQYFDTVKWIDLADHDAGLSAALISWAEDRNIDVNVYPHSHVCACAIPVTKKLTWNSLLRNPYGLLNLTPQKCEVNYLKIKPYVTKKGNNIIVLLNELDCRYMNVTEFISSLEVVAKKFITAGFNFLIRPKPSDSSQLPIHSDLLAKNKLDTYFEWADICVSAGVATSALLGFYEHGAKCFHLTQHQITTDEFFTLPENGVCSIRGSTIDSLWTQLYELVRAEQPCTL